MTSTARVGSACVLIQVRFVPAELCGIGACPQRPRGFPAGRRRYAERVNSAASSENRLRALVETGVAIASELSLEALLQRLGEAAGAATGGQGPARAGGPRGGRRL